jgi:large subunit ribosomal protein L18Ae
MPTKAQLKQVAMPKTLLKEYHVVGRKVPVPANAEKKTPGDMSPQIFRMRIFAPNEVIAKSRYWYFMHQFSKAKKSTGEILTVNEVRERNSNVIKNFGIQIKYNSRSGTHNMYKEYRDVSLCGAVEQMYAELAGRHRARFASIQIVSTHLVPAGVKAQLDYNPEVDGDVQPVAVKRASMKEFLDSQVKFPLSHRIPRASSKSLRSTFTARRPTTFFG